MGRYTATPAISVRLSQQGHGAPSKGELASASPREFEDRAQEEHVDATDAYRLEWATQRANTLLSSSTRARERSRKCVISFANIELFEVRDRRSFLGGSILQAGGASGE